MADLGAIGVQRKRVVHSIPGAVADGGAATVVSLRGPFQISNFKSVRGFAKTEGDDPIGRKILAVDPVLNAVVSVTQSDGTTGAFDLRLNNTDKVTIQVIPLVGDNRNAVALFNITPVDPV